MTVTYHLVSAATPSHLLHQYFRMRHDVFTEYWQLKHYSGSADFYDMVGEIILMIDDGNCVGGIRLVSHPEGSRVKLPLETEEFSLQELLPQLELEHCSYGEVGRSAMRAEYRNGHHSREMYRLIHKRSKELGHRYSFAVSPVVVSRTVRISLKSFGLRSEICQAVKVPALETYEGLEMRLMVMHVAEWELEDEMVG